MKESYDLQDRIRLYTANLQNSLALGTRSEADVPAASEASTHNSAFHQRQTVKLPTLQLPKFTGDPLEWSTFWDSFESAIHHSELPSVDKFNYLKSSLQGSALHAIAGIPVTNASYNTAIDLIKQRFGQPQVIINAHVGSLVTLSPAANDTINLRHLYDSVEMHIRGLATLGLAADTTAGQVLTPIILVKLPAEIRLILTRKHGTAVGDLKQLRDLLKTEVEARELSQASMNQDSLRYNTALPNTNHNFTTGALVTQTNRTSCVFCKGQHSSSSCRTIHDPTDRKSILRRDNRCYKCLRTGHSATRCTSPTLCAKCGRGHHTSICAPDSVSQPQRRSNPPRETPRQNRNFRHQDTTRHNFIRNTTNTAVVHQNINPEDTASADPRNQSTALVATSASNVILMQTALVKTSDVHGKEHMVRLLFDTASQRSYVTSELTEKLGLSSCKSENLCITGFGQRHSSVHSYNVTELTFSSRFDDTTYNMSTLVVPRITQSIFRSPIHETGHTFVSKIQLADPTFENEWISVDVLVGLDYYSAFVDGPFTRIPGTELSAVHSLFGYLIYGKNGPNPDPIVNTFFVQTMNTNDTLKEFWDSETFEACDKSNTPETEDLVLQNFEKTIQMVDGRYEMRFPWKDMEPSLPTNYKLCRNRFQGLVNRLRKTDLVVRYDKIIQQQLDLGFIEPVHPDDPPKGILHYIPHHPVINDERATTKLRIVYDASARLSQKHQSLNDCLYSGPNLLADIHHMLIQFRTYQIVLLADIEKAFLQVVLQLVDRNATRFFWLKDLRQPATDDNILVYRFRRVLFGATCSPFLLAATLRYHLKRHTDPSIQSMSKQFYVDNFIIGTTTANESYEKYQSSKDVLRQAGMNLRERLSNSSEFMNMIPQADRASTKSAKFLGLQWDIDTDTIFVKDVHLAEPTVKITRRHILHMISKVYDPLGIVTPVTVKTKILIQKLWKLNLNWDTDVPESVVTQWKVLSNQLTHLSEAKVQRLLVKPNDSHELHIFVVASQKAYGAVAYLRSSTMTRFVCSKSRVAPVKPTTVPRLELSACVLGCKLAAFLQKTFTSKVVFIWSDSQIVLCWINSMPTKQSVFVTNRVSLIHNHNFIHRYCPTQENPADICSRGSNFSELRDNSLWWNGPQWLSLTSSHWPSSTVGMETLKNVDAERVYQEVLVSTVREITTPYGIDLNRFNRLDTLLKITTLCHKFIKILRKNHPLGTLPTLTEREYALQLWIQWIQESMFSSEFNLLKNEKSNKLIKELQLHLKDGVLVSSGRFSHVTDDSFQNDLILLPSHHEFTYMLIMHHHNTLQHQGSRHTLSSVHERFWIPRGRQTVRYVIKKCIVCKHWEGPSFRLPLPPALPASRVSPSPPFSFTGCDLPVQFTYTTTKKQPRDISTCLRVQLPEPYTWNLCQI